MFSHWRLKIVGFNDDHLKKLEVCVCDQCKIMPPMQNRSDCVKLREQWLINRPAHLGKNRLKWELINLNLFLSLWKLVVISVEECDRCEETLIRGWRWLIGQGGKERSHIGVKFLTDVCFHRGNPISGLIPIKERLNSVKQFEQFEDPRIDNIGNWLGSDFND